MLNRSISLSDALKSHGEIRLKSRSLLILRLKKLILYLDVFLEISLNI